MIDFPFAIWILNNDKQDPGENFFNTFNFRDFHYLTPKESPQNLNCFGKNSSSMLLLSIRSLQKKYDSFCSRLMALKLEITKGIIQKVCSSFWPPSLPCLICSFYMYPLSMYVRFSELPVPLKKSSTTLITLISNKKSGRGGEGVWKERK